MKTKKILNDLCQDVKSLKELQQKTNEDLCELKTGHKYTFLNWEWAYSRYSIENVPGAVQFVFVFECTLCGKRIEKCWDKLTKSEKEAFVALGVIEQDGTEQNDTEQKK
jgi:hypothetical protein